MSAQKLVEAWRSAPGLRHLSLDDADAMLREFPRLGAHHPQDLRAGLGFALAKGVPLDAPTWLAGVRESLDRARKASAISSGRAHYKAIPKMLEGDVDALAHRAEIIDRMEAEWRREVGVFPNFWSGKAKRRVDSRLRAENFRKNL